MSAGTAPPSTTRAAYGVLPDGRGVERYELSAGALRVGVLSFGGIIDAIEVPDAAGRSANVVLGYRDLAGYLAAPHPYFGAIIGRYGNRIAGGRFTLDGIDYTLPINDPPNSLHGGAIGFDRVLWDVEEPAPGELRLRYRSPAGDQGYPGALAAEVTYALEPGALRIIYRATTDAPTIVNLTNHSYFNLAGEDSGDIYDHVLTLDAARYTPVDARMIPTGELAPVAGTPFDFRTPQRIGARIREAHPQLVRAWGYDHNWVLDRRADEPASRAAEVVDPASGRRLEIFTTEPGVQFYSGNFLTGSEIGRGGSVYRQSAGFALETQHFPDSPNQASFPSTVLRPGQSYHSETVFHFSANGTR